MTSKHMIAACVSPFRTDKEAPLNVLAASFYSVIRAAYNSDNIGGIMQSADCVLFVEGTKGMFEVGPLLIFKLPLDQLQEASDMFVEFSKGNDSEDTTPSTDLMVCAIGSSMFCQDVVRFLGLERNGKIDPWFEKFTDRIMKASPDDVVWVDTKEEGPFHEGSLVQLFQEAKRAGAIPG